MGHPAKIKQIAAKDFNRYYINFPRAITMAMDFKKYDPVEWEIARKDTLILKRKEAVCPWQEKI